MNKRINIHNRFIGVGEPNYIVAEIGINHNGDIGLALESIDAAVSAGADAVKFQNYDVDDFIADKKLTYKYVSQGKSVEEAQYGMFKRCQLDEKQWSKIASHCEKVGIDFHSTPTNKRGVDLLVDLGCDVLKNGSDYLGNIPLIEYMAKTGKTVVLSTGMSTSEEIDDAVECISKTGNFNLILLYCVSIYPAPLSTINLDKINFLAQMYDCVSGFSDHTESAIAASLAITKGSCWVEKHFTLDKNLNGPDHAFSSDPDEFSELVKTIRNTELLLTSNVDDVLSSVEEQSRINYKLSCVVKNHLQINETINESDIAFMRPGTGTPPKDYQQYIGKKCKRELEKGHVLTLKDIYE